MQVRFWGVSLIFTAFAIAQAANNQVCVGGPNASRACTQDAQCPMGQCAGFIMPPDRGVPSNVRCPPNGGSRNPKTPPVTVCYGGPNDGQVCDSQARCPQGADGKPTVCDAKKADPNNALDMDVDGDGKADYFMGQWKFVDPASNNNVVVRKWCMNGGPPGVLGTCAGGVNKDKQCSSNAGCPASTCKGQRVQFHDFFSFELRTSIKGVENADAAKRIRPGRATAT